ncbi:MAG: hypothetical protein NC218_10585 [Acetobacter sp.]|nr:hypothetical protein [Acetobacter sp.]
MLLEFDYKKYFFRVRSYISLKFLAILKFMKPRFQDFVQQATLHKEIIIKISVPLFIVILGFYSCTSTQRNISRNVSDIFQISDDIRAHYAGKPDYWGLSTNTILQEKFIASKFLQKNKILLSGGEEILIGSGVNADIIMPRMMTFDIVLSHLNKAQCIAYVENNISIENQVKLQRITIFNDKGTYAFTWGGADYSLPIKKYASKDLCSTSGNTVVWTIQ